MAMSASDVRSWLSTLDRDALVAVDDGGLTLVALTPDGRESGPYVEVGGIPHDGDD